MARLPIKNMDYMTRDYEGFRNLMITKLQELMPEYTDTRQSDAGIVILELNAMCLDILSYYLDSIANECFLVTAEQRSNIMKFCKMLGYTPRFATAARYKQVFVKNDPNVELVIPAGTKVKTYSSNPEAQVFFTTLNNLTIPAGATGEEKDESGNYLYTTDVIHGIYVNNEILADHSNGEENQSYRLNYTPALIDMEYFRVYVGDHAWKYVKSFAGSDSSSEVYTLEVNDYNETRVIFGDNNFGKCPTTNDRITCSYFVGGGTSGNVGVGVIKEMEDNIASIKSTYNVEQVNIGYDQETIDEIKVNAPVAHRNIWGALTCDDFAGVLEVYFPDVFDAEAKKASEDWTTPEVDDIEIYLLTNDEIQRQSALQEEKQSGLFQPLPTSYYDEGGKFDTLKNQIQDFFNSDTDYVEISSGESLDSGRKLVGMRDIILKKANIVALAVQYTLLVRDFYDPEVVAKQIDEYLYNYFKLGNLKFGQEISFQNLMYEIIDNSGIKGIRYLSFNLFGLPPEAYDVNGEVHMDTFSYITNDLVIPSIGTIFVLGSLGHKIPEVNNPTSGGGTLYGR